MSETHQTAPPLSRSVIELLAAGPSPTVRALTAASVATEFSNGSLTEAESRIAVKILEALAQDVAQRVREALAEQVKSCPFLPRSIACTLAQDVEAVALPVIQYSSVLTDSDLVSIVRRGSVAKQLAVAGRQSLAEAVADVLVDAGRREVICTLLGNHGAELWEQFYHKVLDRYATDEGIQKLLVERPILPLTVTERIITLVSEELRERLIHRHEIPPELADVLITLGEEQAITQTVASDTRVEEIERLVNRLFAKRKLSATLVLRALCTGDLHFFEISLATLAQIPVATARTLIYERWPSGLESIYGKTTLPLELFRAFQVAVGEVLKSKRQESEGWSKDYTQRVIDRLVGVYGEVCPQDLEHVLSQLRRLVNRGSDTVTETA